MSTHRSSGIMRRQTPIFALLLAFFGSACEGEAAPDSPTHDIELRSVATLSGVGDSIDLGTGMPAVSASGWIVAPLDFPPSGAVGVFDSTGRFVRRIGRSGGGPGEFRTVQSLGLGPGDSVWVIDEMFRGHVFGPPPSAAFVRTVRFERANTGRITRFGILSSGVYTLNGSVPAHLVNWQGALVREYGAAAPTSDIHDRLGPAVLRDSATAWMPYANSYVLELLGADGTVHQRIERRVPWFPPDSGARTYAWQAPPPPRIHDVTVDRDGLLWVLIRRAHRDWKPQVVGPSVRPDQPVEPRRLGAFNLSEIFEGVIEVLDSRDGRLVASLEVGGGMLGFPEADLLYEVQQDELGRVSTHVWRLALKPK